MGAGRISFAGGIVLGLVMLGISKAMAQPGLDGGAVLRSPFDDEPAPSRSTPAPAPASSFPLGLPMSTAREDSAGYDKILAELSVDPRYAMNKDIEPTPNLGPWMICIHSYITKEAPEWAREFAAELRSQYKMPAYVFTYGLEERRKEFERAKAVLDKQRYAVRQANFEVMYAPYTKDGVGTPIRSQDLPLSYALSQLRIRHIHVQCAVLVGGYANEDAAHNAVRAIQKLKQPDPSKVKLDVKFYRPNPEVKGNTFKSADAEYVNPFAKAFVCRNPSIQHEQPGQKQHAEWNMNLLQKLNSDEPFSLLNCKKPITLAIKQFRTFTAVQSREEKTGLLDNFIPKTRAGSEGVDQAAHDAHELAGLLRKNKNLEVYVLHTEFSSIVTVGGYDSLEDPRLITTQNELGSKLREWDRLMFFPRPMPMQVPH